MRALCSLGSQFLLAGVAVFAGCSASGTSSGTPGAGGYGGSAGSSGAGGSAASGGTGAGGSVAIDSGGDATKSGCSAVDVLFVIDNSSSMCTYEDGLVKAFPFFVDAIDTSLPAGIELHVGITTSSFCEGGSHSESNCVAQESAAEIQAVYKRPQDGIMPNNGYQGRLLDFGGKRFAAATTGDPTTIQSMKDWFSGAAISVGCTGCAFDFSVAGAGYVASHENAANNAKFIRDEGAVLLVFILSDEADHSVEPLNAYHDMLAAAKASCGGDSCIIAGGLLSKFCVDVGTTQVWQFLNSFGEAPVWGDISGGSISPLIQPPDPKEYTKVIADALAPVVKQTCDAIEPVK